MIEAAAIFEPSLVGGCALEPREAEAKAASCRDARAHVVLQCALLLRVLYELQRAYLGLCPSVPCCLLWEYSRQARPCAGE